MKTKLIVITFLLSIKFSYACDTMSRIHLYKNRVYKSYLRYPSSHKIVNCDDSAVIKIYFAGCADSNIVKSQLISKLLITNDSIYYWNKSKNNFLLKTNSNFRNIEYLDLSSTENLEEFNLFYFETTKKKDIVIHNVCHFLRISDSINSKSEINLKRSSRSLNYVKFGKKGAYAVYDSTGKLRYISLKDNSNTCFDNIKKISVENREFIKKVRPEIRIRKINKNKYIIN